MATKHVISRTSNGKYHFALKAGNGEVIGKSEMYSSERVRDKGIESIEKKAASAAVDDRSADRPAA